MIDEKEFPKTIQRWNKPATNSSHYVRMDVFLKRQQDLLECNNRLFMENRALKQANEELTEQSLVTISQKQPKIEVNWGELDRKNNNIA